MKFPYNLHLDQFSYSMKTLKYGSSSQMRAGKTYEVPYNTEVSLLHPKQAAHFGQEI